ncbi:MAG: ABC transporter ATP-binding protein [Deltaproteobacteria bacterium]|nr:ABC transporter ATP-binding protein [Deltaproteobacteria bacterium]
MIEVQNLTRKYGDFTAVKGVSFSIPEGQIIGLLGHNGAGKTTTLKVLTGFLEPSSGTVLIGGQDIRTQRVEIQRRIGYLPENSPLYPEMTVLEYLRYVVNMRGIPEEEQPQAIRDAIRATNLASKAEQKIETLSKGYRQRVGVAQAIIHKPDILILDEPTNGLDPTQILAMRQLIKDLSRHATVILSTHILQEVEAICDRALIIMGGQLVVDSLLSDLQEKETLTILLRQTPAEVEALIRDIPGLKGISGCSVWQGMNQYDIETEGKDPQAVAVLAREIIRKGWDLYSLHRHQQSLETVFKSVNSGAKGEQHV